MKIYISYFVYNILFLILQQKSYVKIRQDTVFCFLFFCKFAFYVNLWYNIISLGRVPILKSHFLFGENVYIVRFDIVRCRHTIGPTLNCESRIKERKIL